MQPLDLIETAKRLTRNQASGRPHQSDLKRAVSSAYYALFHALCLNFANHLVGTNRRSHGWRAWRQTYRYVDHGHAKTQCENKEILSKFPEEIQDFAEWFIELQAARYIADYDPLSRFEKNDVIFMIDIAERVIKAFSKVKTADKRAFAAWTALKNRNPENKPRPNALTKSGVQKRKPASSSSRKSKSRA